MYLSALGSLERECPNGILRKKCEDLSQWISSPSLFVIATSEDILTHKKIPFYRSKVPLQTISPLLAIFLSL